MSNDEFYNPYQFIPVTGKINNTSSARYEFKAIKTGIDKEGNDWHLPNARHDFWQKETFSGRILCKLTTETPLVIGSTTQSNQENKNQEDKNIAKFIVPFSIPSFQFTEFDDKTIITKAMMGTLKEKLEENKARIAIPASSLKGMVSSIAETLSQSALRVLEDKHYSIRRQASEALKSIGLLKCKIDNDKEQWFIQPLCEASKCEKYDLGTEENSYCHENKKYYDLKNDKLCESNKGEYMLYVFNPSKSTNNEMKKKNILIPKSELSKNKKEIPITKDAINEFITLVTERRNVAKKKFTNAYIPKGYLNDPLKDYPLKDGYLIYYQKTESEVTRISYSSIWRMGLSKTQHDYFKEIHTDLLPWSSDRELLTPAEALFGVVSADKDDNKKESQNLAGRVRFSNAFKSGDCNLTPIKLKKLDSPKTPSPAMYFHNTENDTGYIAKKDLGASTHQANGRKYYLHHQEKQFHPETQLPDTAPQTQHKWVAAIKPEQVFYYHIDFENLSNDELGLLLTSLSPDDNFRFKLGMGKPLGLGTVKNEILTTLITDRQKRYTKDDLLLNNLSPNRYHYCIEKQLNNSKIRKLYNNPNESNAFVKDLKIDEAFQRSDKLVDKNSLAVLKILGDPCITKSDILINYPLTLEQLNKVWSYKDNIAREDEGFAWFANNDHKDATKHQALPSLEAMRSKKLTPLKGN